MKKIIMIGALVAAAFTTTAFASSELPNPNANSQGSTVGVLSSRVTHNGGDISAEAQAGTRSADVHAANSPAGQAATGVGNTPPGQAKKY